MEAYTSFAAVYDTFMSDTPYDSWCDYVCRLLQDYGVSGGLLVELGCGTGNLTRRLAAKGYDMIGVDLSAEMLELACRKEAEANAGILYLHQDMRSFELYGTVKAIVSICDSLNYILTEQELLQVFRLINNYLDPGGIFIFDLNTIYKYQTVIGDTTIAENRESGSFIWENVYDQKEQLNEYDLTLFIKEADGRYRKHQETHYQRAYSLEVVRRLLETSGLQFLTAYDAFTREPPKAESERVYMIARELGKEV